MFLQIKNSRTLVPVRFIAESLNADVKWNDEGRAVLIKTSGIDNTAVDDYQE